MNVHTRPIEEIIRVIRNVTRNSFEYLWDILVLMGIETLLKSLIYRANNKFDNNNNEKLNLHVGKFNEQLTTSQRFHLLENSIHQVGGSDSTERNYQILASAR